MEERIEKKIERKIKKMTRKNEQKCSQKRKKRMWKRLKKRWRENKENKKKININVEKKNEVGIKGDYKGRRKLFHNSFPCALEFKVQFSQYIKFTQNFNKEFRRIFLEYYKKKNNKIKYSCLSFFK